MSAATSSLVTFEPGVPLHQPPPLCTKQVVTITDCWYEISKRSNEPMWILTCSLEGKKPIRHYLSFAPGARKWTRRKLNIIAPWIPDIFFPDDIQLIQSVIGIEALAVIRRRWYISEDTPFAGWNLQLTKFLERV